MCDKVILQNSEMFGCIPDCYKNQKIGILPALNYVPEWHKMHKRCDKAADAFLPTLKFVRESFVMSKILENLDDIVFSNSLMMI